jgi:hypothetical protein
MKSFLVFLSSVYFFAILPTISAEIKSGNLIPIHQYLITAKADGTLMARRSEGELVFGSYSGLPFLRDMEFRVRNDAFNPNYMRYTLRLDPRSFGEGQASSHYGEAEIKRNRQRNQLLFNRALVERYLLTVDCLKWNKILILNSQLFGVLEDRIKVLDKRKTTTDFNLADLIEAEIELTNIHSQDLDIRKDLNVLEQQIIMQIYENNLDTTFAGFDTTGLVLADDIIAQVEHGSYGLDSNHIYLEYLKQGLVLAESRYKMEKASGQQFLSFLSFSYDVGNRLNEMDRRDAGKDYDLGRAYSVEAGFRLPFLTTGSQELNRRKEQLLSEKENYQENRKQLEDMMHKDIKDIHSLVIQYRYLKARETQVDAEASLKKYMQMSGVDPLALLSIKAGDLKNRMQLEDVKYGIIRNWIKVLNASGKLSQEPLKNWLAIGQPEIKK